MINAHIGLTYACNMNCAHCYVKGKKRTNVDVRTDELLDKLEQLGTFYITYTMGETLLWSGFPEFAKKAFDRGFYQILLSNGSTIQSEETVAKLERLGIKKVGISIDSSDPEIHDKNRRFAGAHRLACNAIRLLSANPKIWTQIAVTIGNHNLHDISKIITDMRALGAHSFSFLWMRGKSSIEPICDIKEYEETMGAIIKMRETEGVDINVHDYRLNPLVERMYRNGEISIETKQDVLYMNTCHALSELVLIDPSGNMYACNFSPKPFANIYSSSLEEIAAYSCSNLPLCGGTINEIQ